MLTQEENERLSRVGPGTPVGTLLRRYWHPVAPTADLDQDPVRPVRLLGEDLVLYRDESGKLGLVAERCAHWPPRGGPGPTPAPCRGTPPCGTAARAAGIFPSLLHHRGPAARLLAR